jgi:sterol desaturase/sphingolipid hydroxylase (fatty acid hydroxylase superfamily)
VALTDSSSYLALARTAKKMSLLLLSVKFFLINSVSTSCFEAMAVILSLVYTALSCQWAYMSLYIYIYIYVYICKCLLVPLCFSKEGAS